MPRNICITAVDGHTGHLITELLITDENFKKGWDSLTGLSMHPTTARCKELDKQGVKIIPHKPGRLREMVETLKQTGADTLCLIPPAHKDKFNITVELIEAAKKANVPNVCFISSAGADLAEKDKQPRLREFVDLECLIMAAKGDPETATGHSPVIIRWEIPPNNRKSRPVWLTTVARDSMPRISCCMLHRQRTRRSFPFQLEGITSLRQFLWVWVSPSPQRRKSKLMLCRTSPKSSHTY